MAKKKNVYCCTSCGNETTNWSGRCPSCGEWNTLEEVNFDIASTMTTSHNPERKIVKPKKISQLDAVPEIRFSTGISELDRVLGGGCVAGSLNLVGGSPGIGKSTLLLQVCSKLCDHRKILYISGEESEHQLKIRADRIGMGPGEIYVLTETELNNILICADELAPDVIILDSIQTISDDTVNTAAGSVSQIRECTMRIMRYCKERGTTIFIVGHITKDGNLAGPKILEHMVDCVLYFEGERNTSFRILRAVKNRFGSTNEIGVFDMKEHGLECVSNPSEALLAGRPENAPGTCVTCVMEGSRPILAEIQALVSPTNYNPSRRVNGIDFNRVAMLLAVTEKRGGLPVASCDNFINVVGGLYLDEPAADLSVCLSIASSYLDRPLGTDLAAIGEVGLAGEIRSISNAAQRVSEIERLGFKRCIIPQNMLKNQTIPENLQVFPANNLRDAIRLSLGKSE